MSTSINLNKRPLCEAPFRNKGTFYTENGVPQYTPCCFRDMPALNASHWQDDEIISLRKGLARIGDLHPACQKCLSFGAMATARLYDTQDGTLANYGFDPDTGRTAERNLTSCTYIGAKCNLGCRMCNGRVSNTFNYVHPEIAEKAIRVEDSGYDLKIQSGATSVCVAGGEPLMISSTADIVEQCAAAEVSAFIITNGSIKLDGNQIYETIKANKDNTWVMVSLDADWERHEWIRIGIDIELLKRNIQTMLDDGVLRGFNIVVSSMNYDRFLFPFELAHQLGLIVDVTFLNEPSVLSCKHVAIEKRRTYAAEILRFVKSNKLSSALNKSAMQAISGLLSLPFDGDVSDDKLYMYLTREIE